LISTWAAEGQAVFSKAATIASGALQTSTSRRLLGRKRNRHATEQSFAQEPTVASRV